MLHRHEPITTIFCGKHIAGGGHEVPRSNLAPREQQFLLVILGSTKWLRLVMVSLSR